MSIATINTTTTLCILLSLSLIYQQLHHCQHLSQPQRNTITTMFLKEWSISIWLIL